MSLVVRSLSVLGSRKRLAAGLSFAVAAASGVGGGPHGTNLITAQPTGGVTPYTYAWAQVSGDASIAISNAAIAGVTWSASGTPGTSKYATWRCTITDAAGVVVTTADVSVSVSFTATALSVGLSTGTVTGGGTGNGPFNTGVVAVSASGGVAPYVYLWQYVGGDGSLSPNDGNIHNPYFIGSGTAPSNKSGTWRCRVTDNVGTVAYTGNVSISIDFIGAALSVSLNKNYVSGGGTGGASTDSVTATPSGGTGPYTYKWERVSGDTTMFATNSTGATTAFVRTGANGFYSTYWRCKVTDNVGAIAYSANVLAEVELA